MKSIFIKLICWSWLITVPINLVGGYVTYRALDRVLTFEIRYDSAPASSNLKWSLEYEFDRLIRQANVLFQKSRARHSSLKTINIFVKESNLKKLETHLPQSAYNYVKARILIDNKFEKAKIKYRGDYFMHWALDKKSIRVKTSKKQLYGDMRTFNLQAPKSGPQLNNYLSFKLASELRLINPKHELVNLSINNKNRGIHILVEQLEELTLRRSGFMPADIYRGEMGAKDYYTDHGVKNLFESSAVWDKMSINNHYPIDSFAPLEKLLLFIKNRSQADVQNKLSNLLDMEAWARFSAFEALSQSKHYDTHHNYRIYYDPWRQKLLPIVWDPIGWARSWWVKPNETVDFSIILHEFHRTLFMNGDFLRARSRIMKDFFESGKSEKFLEITANTINLMKDEIKLDPYIFPMPVSRIGRNLDELFWVIKKGFQDINTQLQVDNDASYNAVDNVLSMKFGGMFPLEKLQIELKTPLNTLTKVSLHYLNRKEDIVRDITNSVSMQAASIEINAGYLPNFHTVASEKSKIPNENLISNDAVYNIVFEGLSLNETIASVKADFGQGYKQIDHEHRAISLTDIEHIFIPSPILNSNISEIWSGKKIISEINIITRPVIIEPGTQVLLEKGSSLVFKNRLYVNGTVDKPVEFKRNNKNDGPWGTIALIGEAADRSELKHCQFSGGSGYKTKLAEYTGMFSLHDVEGVKITDCKFSDNSLVDDMIHVVYSDVVFQRSVFNNSFLDALDIDMSKIKIINSSFFESGNDAIDLMSSNAQIINSRLRGSGDKGISVGEGSYLFALNNTIDNNKIGVQSKDNSVSLIFNQNLVNNGQALHAYRKNWRYGTGGYIYVAKTKILGNKIPEFADKKSHISIFDSYLDDIKIQKRISHKLVDSNNMVAVDERILLKHFSKEKNDEIRAALDDVPISLIAQIDIQKRGVKENVKQ